MIFLLRSPPRAHLTRFHGVLAPNARIRSKIVPKQEEATENSEEKPKRKRMSWAKLLKRVFGIDMEKCTQCGGKMRVISAIMEEAVIEKILKHLGRPYKPPDIAPARYPEQLALF